MQPDRGRARPFCEREVKLAADVDLPTSVFWRSLAQIVSMSDDRHRRTARTPFGGALTAGRRKTSLRHAACGRTGDFPWMTACGAKQTFDAAVRSEKRQ